MDKLKINLTSYLLIILLHFIHASKYTGKLLVVSFDGFRWDYTQFTDTPNFDKLERLGTRVEYMNGVFPTKTFPSHYSIATGLHPESHGIVGNYMYDPELDLHFSPRDSQNPEWWNKAEPIWITARKQGLTTATYFWVGSTIELHGMRPHFLKHYSESVPLRSRVDTVVEWFVQYDVDFAMLYFNEPDSTAHRTGTRSHDTVQMIKQCDATLGYLLRQLRNYHLDNELNILIVSDHGMTDVQIPQNLINLADYISYDDIITIADEGAIANILPKQGQIDKVYTSLKDSHPHMTVYKREELPSRFHFNKHTRIHPIIIMPDEGWLVVKNASEWFGPVHGAHGYDNELMSMKPFFRAMGPNIKPAFNNDVFNQTDLYPLMCELLGIQPAPNNGSLDVIRDMLMLSGCDVISTMSHRNYIIMTVLVTLFL